MLNTILRIGIGVVIGAISVKENENVSAAYDKAKAKIKKLVERLFIEETPKENGAPPA